jgi:hypothetical protein
MRRILLLLALLSCSACSSMNQGPSQAKDCGCTAQPSGPLKVNASNSFIALAGPQTGDAAAASKTGDFLVSSNGIKAVFENTTTGTVTTVRHRPSGLVCIAPQVMLTPKAQVTQFDPALQSGCLNWESGVQNNLMVMPNAGSVPAAEALAALMHREQTLQPALINKTENGLGAKGSGADYASGSLTAVAGPAPQYVHFSVATVNGWIVLDQTSGSQAQAAVCDRVADSGVNSAVANIHKPGA